MATILSPRQEDTRLPPLGGERQPSTDASAELATQVTMATAARAAQLPSLQKAAILLVGLGPEVAAPILKVLPDDQIERLTTEIFKLGPVDDDLTDAVFLEVYDRLRSAPGDTKGGEAYAKELLGKALDKKQAGTLLEKISGKLHAGPFDFLNEVDAVQIVNTIQSEHPQTVSLILAHLPPQHAAMVLSGLPAGEQPDLVRRLATMNPTTPDVVREVESHLKRKLSSVGATRQTRVGGIPYLVNILNSMETAAEKSILETLEEESPELAEEIRKNLFTFEDIVRLTDKDMQRVWRELPDQRMVALSLRGSTEEARQKFLSNTSTRNRTALTEEIELLGPTRVSAVDEAQGQIITIIRRLEQAQEIEISRGGAGEETV